MTPTDVAHHHRASDELPLRDILAALRRRLPIVVVAAVALASAALAYSLQAEKQYTATAKLLFRDPGFDQKLFGTTILAPSRDPDREAATNVSLVSLDTISEKTARALRGSSLTPADVRAKVQVTSEGRSNVVAVMATDPDPTFAATLANTIARQYIRVSAGRRPLEDHGRGRPGAQTGQCSQPRCGGPDRRDGLPRSGSRSSSSSRRCRPAMPNSCSPLSRRARRHRQDPSATLSSRSCSGSLAARSSPCCATASIDDFATAAMPRRFSSDRSSAQFQIRAAFASPTQGR